MKSENFIKISILIPMYNVEDYIIRCLDSIFCQINDDVEVIVINDGSKDSSLDIVKKYQKNNKISNFHIVSHENNGISYVRNEAITLANGEYVWFIDSDDYIYADTLSIILALLKEKKMDIIELGYDLIDLKNEEKSKRVLPIIVEEEICGLDYLNKTLKKNMKYEWMPWKYIFRRKVFIDLNLKFPVGKKYEDVYVFPELILNSKSILTINKPCYIYLYHRKGAITNEYSLTSEFDKQYALINNFNTFKNKKIYARILNNLSYLYYSSIILGKYLNETEWEILLDELKKNIWIIKYTTSGKQVIIKYLIKVFGLDFTSKLLAIRRFFKNG